MGSNLSKLFELHPMEYIRLFVSIVVLFTPIVFSWLGVLRLNLNIKVFEEWLGSKRAAAILCGLFLSVFIGFIAPVFYLVFWGMLLDIPYLEFSYGFSFYSSFLSFLASFVGGFVLYRKIMYKN